MCWTQREGGREGGGGHYTLLHVGIEPLEALLSPPTPQDVQAFNSVAEMEKFLLEHGEQVIDTLGVEVDRIELGIKVQKTAMEPLIKGLSGLWECYFSMFWSIGLIHFVTQNLPWCHIGRSRALQRCIRVCLQNDAIKTLYKRITSAPVSFIQRF